MKALFSILFFFGLLSPAQAVTLNCFDKNVQDGQFSASFLIGTPTSTVTLFVPSGESSGTEAIGVCLAEEDSRIMSLRCDDIRTSGGQRYFVRVDGFMATVAKDGQILATLPCF